MAMAPHRWYVQPILALYITFGVGCYCFIRTKAMREAREMGKADIVPTPLLYIIMPSRGLGSILFHNEKNVFYDAYPSISSDYVYFLFKG